MKMRDQGLEPELMITLVCVGTVALLFFCNMVYGGWVRRSELEQCRAYYVNQHMDESDVDRKCGVGKKR